MTAEAIPSIPPIVRDSYGIIDSAHLTRLAGGLVNETLLVEQQDRTLVLRKLAPIIGTNTIKDTCVIGSHLQANGWEAPTIEPTLDGEPYVTDASNRLWHGMHFIESDNQTPERHDAKLALQVGQLLGGWHATVKPLTHTPDSLPYFHDTAYIAQKLESELRLFSGQETQDLANTFLQSYKMQAKIPTTELQIIHGDPKLDNMLYRNGEPFTLIDFDCVMQDTVWTDVGDFLRSLSGKIMNTEEKPEELFGAFIEGYLVANDSKLSFDEAFYNALQATRRIACELGMRYLSDIVDGQEYFVADSIRQGARQEVLLAKAWTQYQILAMIEQNISEGEL